MTHILIPSMGKSLFFADSYFPKPMIEICGKTMLEYVIDDYKELDHKHFIFVFSKDDCCKFHLDDSVRILTNEDAEVLILKNETEGALCTCLMAIEFINNDDPLIIANCDQIIDVDYSMVINGYESEKADAGVIIFNSVHPRWSYVKMEHDEIVETAEKRPLSKNAIAGFYYFRKGKDFINAAKKVIIKGNRLAKKFYISSVLNELVLMDKHIGYYSISQDKYCSFYSPEKIREYENKVREERL